MRILRHAKGLGLIGLCLLLLIAVFDVCGVQMTKLSRDPLQRLHLPVYLGLLSYLGVLAWCAASSIMLFAAFLIRQKNPDSIAARFSLWMGILAAILFLDDLFMLHETIVPMYLHLPEMTLYFVYAVYMSFLLLQFRQFILEQTDYGLFLLACICFGFSIGIDIDLIPGKIGTEDTLKIFGIAIHCYYCIVTATQSVRSAHATTPA
jgi:hypothetical protein